MTKIKQTMRGAALQPTLMSAALAYAKLGLSVIPVRGKACRINWNQYQHRPADENQIRVWFGDSNVSGLAIIAGRVSGNLVILDFDGLDCVREFQNVFPALTQTYMVLSGSRQGAHFYYYVDRLPPTTRTKGFELRADGHYVVAPPSLHPSGNRYTVYAEYEPLRLPDLDNVAAWISGKKAARGYLPAPAAPAPASCGDDPFTFNPRNPGRQIPRPEYMRLSWLAMACQREIGWLRSQKQGSRNDSLFRSSIVLAQLVASGELDEQRTRAELLAAALTTGTPEEEALRTIDSGFKRGLGEPRRAPKG